MARRILDTSVILRHWLECGGYSGQTKKDEVREWAKKLIEIRGTNLIVTPVLIEMLAGANTAAELDLLRAYLEQFRVIDERKIPAQDWSKAQDYAQRVPRRGNRRQLGDCLIRAIADRLHYDVDTLDKRFPR
jgi:predicted nucleic acid-binding protein